MRMSRKFSLNEKRKRITASAGEKTKPVEDTDSEKEGGFPVISERGGGGGRHMEKVGREQTITQ